MSCDSYTILTTVSLPATVASREQSWVWKDSSDEIRQMIEKNLDLSCMYDSSDWSSSLRVVPSPTNRRRES